MSPLQNVKEVRHRARRMMAVFQILSIKNSRLFVEIEGKSLIEATDLNAKLQAVFHAFMHVQKIIF